MKANESPRKTPAAVRFGRRVKSFANKFAPTFEILERRIALAMLWSGKGDGSSWSDPRNWDAGRVPGANDDVLIDVPGDLTVVYRGSPSTVRTLVNSEEIWVQGSAPGGAAVLRTSAELRNLGTIRLETTSNTDFDQGSYIASAGTFINEPSGLVVAKTGAGDPRTIFGSFTNRGSATSDGIDLRIVDTYSADGGTLGGGAFLWDADLLVLSSTPAPTTIRARGFNNRLLTDNLPDTSIWVEGTAGYGAARLTASSGVSNRGDIRLETSSNTDSDQGSYLNLSGLFVNEAGATIRAFAGQGDARSIGGSLTNRGTVTSDGIDLTIVDTYIANGGMLGGGAFLWDADLRVTSSPATPTTIRARGFNNRLLTDNLPDTSIWVEGTAGYGAARLTASSGVSNRGDIRLETSSNTDSDQGSYLVAAGSFINEAGATIRALLGAGDGRAIGGSLTNRGTITTDAIDLPIVDIYLADGGSLGGGAFLWDSDLSILTSPASPTTIRVRGFNNRLFTDNLPDISIWVEGTIAYGASRLTTADGVFNRGDIRLETTSNDSVDRGSYLIAGASFVNASGATIRAFAGQGDARSIGGPLTNRGTVTSDGIDLTIVDTYIADGGTVGSGAFLWDADLRVTSTPASPTTIRARGFNNRLFSDNLPNTTLLVEGTIAYGAGRVTTSDGVTNRGEIRLETSSNDSFDRGSYLNVGASFVNASGGTIRAVAGQGDPRVIFGPLTNQGLVTASGIDLQVVDIYVADGGTLEGGAFLLDAELREATIPLAPTTVRLRGFNNVLATDNLPGMTLWVEGTSNYGAAGLRTAAGVVNRGTIRLETSSNTFNDQGSYLIAGGITLVNAAGGLIESIAGAGDPRGIQAQLVNYGYVKINTGTTIGLAGANHFNLRVIDVRNATLTVTGASLTNAGSGIIGGGGALSRPNVSLTNRGILDLSAPSIVDAIRGNDSVEIFYYAPPGMNETEATDPANYRLLASRMDGTFDDGNEVDLIPGLAGVIEYDPALRRVTMRFGAGLPDDDLRLTVRGATIHDRDGILLDANDLLVVLPREIPFVAVDLQAASDTGVSSTDNLTRETRPIFDLTINKPGRVELDVDGDGIADGTEEFVLPGTYPFTSPLALADGTRDISVRFVPIVGTPATASLTVTIDATAPRIDPLGGTVQAPVRLRTLRFSETVVADGVTASSITVEGPDGVVPISRVIGSGRVYELSFDYLTVGGQYVVRSADSITDLAGNPLDASITDSFTLLPDTVRPFVTSFSPFGLLSEDVTRFRVVFSELMALGSFQNADIRVTAPSGVLDPNMFQISVVDERTFDVIIPAQSEEGDYSVTVGPAITDLSGNAMFAPYEASFAIDKSGPRVVSHSPSSQASAPLSSLRLAFSEPIDAASLTAADIVSFFGPDGSDLLSTITDISVTGSVATINFSALTGQGRYTVVVGPQIRDLVGNLMDQDQDGNLGEVDEDTYTTSFVLLSPDLTVTSLSLPGLPPAGALFGRPLNVSWTVRNIGTDPANDGWVDRVWFSRDAIAGNADDRLLLTLSPSTGSVPLAPGGEYSRTATVTLPLDTTLEPGNYQIIVVADATGSQLESSEANNSLDVGLALSLPPLPDLLISEIVAPVEAISGQALPVSWTLENRGTAAAGPFTDRVYLSDDDSLGEDILLGSFAFNGILPAGGTIARSQLISIPAGLTGRFYLLVVTDAIDEVYEHDGEGNNASTSPGTIEVRRSTRPDLRVISVTTPSDAFSEQEVVVAWVVENAGDGATSSPSWYDRVYLSDDPQFNPLDDLFLGSAVNASYLDAGGRYTGSLAVTLPRGIDGDYYIVIVTDAGGVVAEPGAEDNNTGAGGPIDVHLTPPPDLVVSSVLAPGLGFSGQPIIVRWTVTNQGPADIKDGTWSDAVYLSTDDQLDSGDVRLGVLSHGGGVAFGESYTAEGRFLLPVDGDGAYYVIVATDSGNTIYEHLHESNNVGIDPTPLVITPVRPDLEVATVIAPATARAGTAMTISYRVENRGIAVTSSAGWTDALYLSTDAIFDPSVDRLLGSRPHYGPLDPDQGYDASFDLVLPQGIEGPYHVFVATDTGRVVLELDDANNSRRSDGILAVESRPADLVARVDALPTAVSAGSAFLISWSVVNEGSGDTIVDRWSNAVYLSSDEVFGNGDDRLLVQQDHVGLVGQGGVAVVKNLVVLLPLNVAPGSYHIFVVADAGNRVFEAANEGNNASDSVPLTVNRATANLRVTALSAPAEADAGTYINVSWTVANAGPVATDAFYWHDAVFLSRDAVAGGSDDVRLGSLQHNNLLGAGGYYTAATSFRLPSNLDGDYFLYVATDDGNRVLEDPSELDNVRMSAGTIAVHFQNSPPPLTRPPGAPGSDPGPDPSFPPDLRVTSVAAPDAAVSGQSIDVSWTVRNSGYDAEGWSWSDAVYLSIDQVLDLAHDVPLGYRDRPADDLPTGAVYTRTASFTIPRGLAGRFYVFVLADAGRRIAEPDEFDNFGYDGLSMAVALPPPTDLVVGTIAIPATGRPGELASITYRVDNLGSEPALGSWTDTLYLSADGTWDIGDLRIGSVLHAGTVPGGASYTETLEATLPGVLPGQYHVIVRSDIRNQIPEADESNNIAGSLERVVLDLDALTLGVPVAERLAEGQYAYYKVVVPGGEALRLTFDSVSDTAANELYIRFGAMPSRTEYDARFNAAFEPDQQVVVPITRAGTYYILAYGAQVEGGPASYTIQADILDFDIQAIDVVRGSNRGEVTLTVSGSKFTPGTTVQLVGPGGSPRPAERVWWIDESTLWATIDLRGLDPGRYDVAVAEGSLAEHLEDAFLVTAGPLGEVRATVDTPTWLRPGQSGYITVRYVNIGETDALAPVLKVHSTNALLLGTGDFASTDNGVAIYEAFAARTGGVVVISNPRPIENQVTFLAINPDGPAGILPPGAEHTILIPFEPTITQGSVEVEVSALAPDDLDWESIKGDLRPPGLSDEAWNVLWSRFRAEVGTTPADLTANLSENATYLSQLGVSTYGVARLLGFELSQADNSLPGPVLLQAVDAAATVPGLPMIFGRVARQNLSGRYALGRFGRGWTDNWDYSVTTAPDGNVLIWANGAVRSFLRQEDGTYQGLPGDTATLTLHAYGPSPTSHYSLRESDGTAFTFLPDGRLGSILDPNGNRIDATYTAGRLTGLQHTSGASFTLQYNALGRVNRLIDDAGRITTYAYDPSGQYLLQVTNEQGTTTFTYHAGGPDALRHALTSATGPDGVTLAFTYDSRGRLAGQSLNGGAQALAFTYGDVGLVSVTDAAGATTHRYFDDSGQTRQIRDALGQVSKFIYDDAGNLVAIAAPSGVTSNIAYDANGNPTRGLDPLGNLTEFEFDPTNDRLVGIRNPNDQELRYTHDARGNVTSIVYADGTFEQFQYDVAGLVVRSINRRGQGINYTYDARGLLTHKRYDDGTTFDYTYDGRGNLLTATDVHGTTKLTYDGQDRLSRIEYPGGRSLAFRYDAAGRRVRSVDQDGFTVNYRYDALGRLAELTDGSGARIVAYTYDRIGRLARKDLGNGTYTTYDFDQAGRMTALINHAPDGSVNSSFLYAYDRLGRQTSVTTLDGTTYYDYDSAGQLVGVRLPGGRVIEYFYDANGNRQKVVDDGVVTFYATNALDQYTQVGSAVYTYDLDGNLIQIVDGTETTTYGYDAENRLISVVSPAGIWTHEYDAFGNRIATTENGVRTEYLFDPAGYGNIVAEYTESELVAHYTHGQELISRIDGTGDSSYFDFDYVGSTIGVTGVAGSYLNRYRYLPFGEVLSSVESVSNAYQYVGQYGILTDANGIVHMRARAYDPAAGRFMQLDPINLLGGTLNLTSYAHNNPVNLVDPQGTIVFVPAVIAGGAVIGGLINGGGYLVGGNATLGGFAGAVFSGAIQGAVLPIAAQVPFATGILVQSTAGAVGGAISLGLGSLSSDPLDPNSGIGKLSGFLSNYLSGFLPIPILNYKGWGLSAFGTIESTRFLNVILGKIATSKAFYSTLALSTLVNIVLEKTITFIATVRDPNDITGPQGFGDEKWLSQSWTLDYTVRFENDPAFANSPVQILRITQQLDPSFDPRSVRIGGFGFGDQLVVVPNTRGYYTDRLDLRSSLGLFIDVNAGVDVRTGQLFWQFTAIDPATGAPPLDPQRGFLPPNVDGRGQGFVTYTVRAQDDVPSGTVVSAQARIVFDSNPPIDTNTFTNTIDAGIPTSQVIDATPAGAEGVYLVSWIGEDESSGSGLSGFDLYVARGDGPFELWLAGTTQTQSLFVGEPGVSYAFYSITRDNAGNVEAPPPTPDVIATVPTPASDTTVAVQSSRNPAKLGDLVTFTAIVAAVDPDAGPPLGSVQFLVDGVSLGSPVLLVNGSAASPGISTLALGNHVVTANYINSDPAFNPSGGSLAGGQTIIQADSTTSVSSSSPTSVYGRPLTFTAFVSAVTSGLPKPSGMVQFRIDGLDFGPAVALVNGSATSDAIATLPVGTHAVTVVYAGDGNFTGSTSGDLIQTVSRASITVTADDRSRTYGDANPILTVTYTGFVNGDTAGVIGGTPSITTDATTSSGVGDYAITPGPGTLSAANYDFSFVAGTLTVTKARLTVAPDSKTRVYGAANPVLTYTLSGFVNGDTASSSGITGQPNLSTTATSASPVGSYPIQVDASPLASPNYSFTAGGPATLTITPATLTLIALDQRIDHGDLIPPLTYAFRGFVNGDNPSVVNGSPILSTGATPNSSAGFYAIDITGGNLASRNYTFSFQPGLLTVHPKVLDVRARYGTKSISLIGLGRDLPFINIDAIDVLFSDDVEADLADFSLAGLANAYTPGGYRYDPARHQATWTLPTALGIDRLMLHLDGTSPSGIQTPGTHIGLRTSPELRFSVLPGDVNGDGVVNSQDQVLVRNQMVGSGDPGMLIWADVNGDGVIDLNDFNAVKKKSGTSLK